MIKHFPTKHPLEYAEMREESVPDMAGSQRPAGASSATVQPTLYQTIDRTLFYKNYSAKKKELNHLLMKTIVQDLQPLSITEDKRI